MSPKPRLGAFAALLLTSLAGPALAQDSLYVFDGVGASDMRAVRAAGDLNQDGYADLVSTGYKSTRVFSGKDGLPLKNLGQDAARSFSLGDADGDGIPDFVTSLGNSPYHVVSGVTLAPIASLVHFGFGHDVAAAGDVNNNGFDDVIVGAPYEDTTSAHSGKATVYDGNTGALLYQFNGAAYQDYFGYFVAAAGDVDADGFADVIASCDPYGDDARVLSGQAGALLHQYIGGGSCPVSGVGDIDQDGFDDFVVGLVGGTNLAAYSGATGLLLRSFPIAPSYWMSVGRLGDVTGDGVPDVLAAAPDIEAYVFSGATGTAVYTIPDPQPGSGYGFPIVGLGDVNADGGPDFAVSAQGYDGVYVNQGRATVYSGRSCSVTRSYSFGCAGSGGHRPKIFFTGCLAPQGAANFHLTSGLGGSIAWLVFGHASTEVPMEGGCSLKVSPLLPIAVPLPLGGAGPGNGAITFPVTLPTPGAAGTFTTQAFVLDPGVPHGYANSNGLEVTLVP